MTFDILWSAYPRRAGSNPKQPARKAFERALWRGAYCDDIIVGAMHYAAGIRQDGKEFTPYVAQLVTWLNQERWLDEYIPDIHPHNHKRAAGSIAKDLADDQSYLTACIEADGASVFLLPLPGRGGRRGGQDMDSGHRSDPLPIYRSGDHSDDGPLEGNPFDKFI